MKSRFLWCLAAACCLAFAGPAYAQDCLSDADCDDGNPCTIDTCDPITRTCVHVLIPDCVPCQTASECDDGDPCTIDECIGGLCVNTPIPDCIPCQSPSDCDDGDPCTIDECINGQCVFTPIAGCEPCLTAADCDDGNACTIDECINGQCVHTPVVCDDGDPCTTDLCDPASGCIFVPIPGCGGTDCMPRADGLGCEPVPCPDPTQECKPRCVTEGPGPGQIHVTDCECRDPNACYVVWDAGVPPFCEGICPPGEICVPTVTTNADGSVTTCCDCQPDTPQFCPLPDPPIVPLCQNLQPLHCVDGDPATDQCLARIVIINAAGQPMAEECACYPPTGICGPVLVTGTMARCPGVCPVPPYNPNDICQVFLDGNPTGLDFVDMTTLPAGTTITCDCEQVMEPEGACCDANGLCVVLPQSQCTGTYLGDGTTCLGLGACCYDADGDGISESCARMDQVCCEILEGGTFQGLGTACLGVGACCFDGPVGIQCVQVDEICCDDFGGSFLGVGSVCLGDGNGDGHDDACVPPPQDCLPTADGLACQSVPCPVPGEECVPRCAHVSQGKVTIIDCDCRSPNECHLELIPPIGTPCPQPDNGTGTVDLPPNGCPYLSPYDDMQIVDGLPVNTTIDIDASLNNYAGALEVPGGALGGTVNTFDAVLQMPMSGTGALAGFNRLIAMPIVCEVHLGPRNPGDAVQTFPTDMVILQGELFGDPDFDILRVAAGTGFGLPSPGHTTLTRLGPPGSDFTVDSFFDIEYRIEFQGAPGSALEGFGGVTTATVRVQIGNMFSPTPVCVGDCPPGFICERSIFSTPDGYEVCCDCVPDVPQECAATPDGLACEPFICPDPTEQCKPRCARLDPATGEVLTLDCDCLQSDECFVVAVPGTPPFCEGNCPPGETCVENMIINADGTVDMCCDCVRLPCECPGDINGDGLVNGQDIQGFVRCLLGNPLPADHCECADMDGDGDHDFDDVPLFVQRLLACEPCEEAPCPPTDLLLDIATGVFDGGGLIPVGTDDDTWTVTVDASGGIVPRPAKVITPNPAWLTIPGTRWIAANATGPNGDYHYEFCFCLDDRFKNAQLDLQLRADDRAEVFLNGTSIGATPASYAFNTPVPTMVSTSDQSLFVVGENCVTVVVTNSHGVVTGLNLAGTVSAMDGECCCDPEPLDRNLDSGVDDTDGSLIPISGDDDTWNVIVDASGGTVPRPATIITPNPAWLTIPGTRWISAAATGPNGLYVYEYCFCLDPRWENAQLIMDLRADDNASVWLNGVQVGATPLSYAFNTPSPTHIWVTNQSLFVPGENCIEVRVNNTHGVVTGVNIAASVTADKGLCCDDEPAPLECVPTADGQACEQANCTDPAFQCLPVCVNVGQDATGVAVYTVLQCDCMDPSQCHIVFDAATPPYCEGECPANFTCVTTELPNPTLGGFDICCRCEPLPVGACCLSSGPCIIATPYDCEVQGGVYLGDNTQCTGVEACCLPDGFCIEVEPICCELLYGGTPQGAGTICLGDANGNGIDDACEVPPAQLSCCDAEGQCVDLAPGTTQCPPGSTLQLGPCGFIQACCLPNGQCIDMYEPCCLAQGGKPQGLGTDCTTVECPPQLDDCRPLPDGSACQHSNCAYTHQYCHPTRVTIDPLTGAITVLECDCDNPKACQIQFNGTPFPDCKGKCPGGMQCVPVQADNPDGTFDFWCDCMAG